MRSRRSSPSITYFLSLRRISAAPSPPLHTSRTPPPGRLSIAEMPTFSLRQRITTTPSSRLRWTTLFNASYFADRACGLLVEMIAELFESLQAGAGAGIHGKAPARSRLLAQAVGGIASGIVRRAKGVGMKRQGHVLRSRKREHKEVSQSRTGLRAQLHAIHQVYQLCRREAIVIFSERRSPPHPAFTWLMSALGRAQPRQEWVESGHYLWRAASNLPLDVAKRVISDAISDELH